tara:strand:+ start:857 stop:1858 length:1002 start_codon:yes stop_codon:yes gene_type:complete
MRILITGTAGFIGFHLAKTLLESGMYVHGYDGMTDYYDVNLKHERHKILESFPKFSKTIGMLEEKDSLNESGKSFNPDIIIHLAAQAGVRYSLENPKAYIDSNIVGTFNIIELARSLSIKHLLMASTSSVYGANTTMPFEENQNTDTPLTIYAATKKATESMAHSYAHLWKLPVTMFRFFTVYGPYGRPDMALFKFTKGIIEGQPIDIYNNGEMYRDFTYVDDLVLGIKKLISKVPGGQETRVDNDSLSPVAPYRIVNIGNSNKVQLLDFIKAIEEELDLTAIKNFMPMQEGDVPATWADATLLENLTGFKPNTPIKQGVKNFINWYKEYYSI